MKTKEELKDIYNSLTEGEKKGIQFGLFPLRLQNLTQEETAELIRISGE